MKGDRIRSRDLRLQGAHSYCRTIRSFDTTRLNAARLVGLSDTVDEDNAPGIVRMREILRLARLRAQVRRCALL